MRKFEWKGISLKIHFIFDLMMDGKYADECVLKRIKYVYMYVIWILYIFT